MKRYLLLSFIICVCSTSASALSVASKGKMTPIKASFQKIRLELAMRITLFDEGFKGVGWEARPESGIFSTDSWKEKDEEESVSVVSDNVHDSVEKEESWKEKDEEGAVSVVIDNVHDSVDTVHTVSSSVPQEEPMTPVNKSVQEIRLEVAAGITTFGSDFKGVGYKMRPETSALVRVGAMKKIDDKREIGVCLIGQWEGKAKTSYTAGVSSNIQHAIAKFHTASILATGRYLGEKKGNFTPYVTASIGFAVNSLKEVHTGDSAQSEYRRKTNMQPAFGAGFGAKYEINETINLFAEYQYLDSGKLKTSNVVHTNGTLTSEKLKHKLRQNLILVGAELCF